MRIHRILPLAAMLLCCLSSAAFAGEAPPSPAWDAVLDGIYTRTWQGNAALAADLKKEEARIGQSLPDYIAAWDRTIAVPIRYVGKERTGDHCSPFNYCSSDFLDSQKLVAKLRAQKEPMASFLVSKLSPEARKTITGSSAAPGSREKASQGSKWSAFPEFSFLHGKTDQDKSPPPNMSAQDATRLLSVELSRIVREDTFYHAEQSAWLGLSFTALALVKEHYNDQNRVCVNKTILAEAFPGELARNFKCVIQKDDTYRRVVAAKTLNYLVSGKTGSLDEAIALSNTFASKLMYTNFAFWYYYPRVLSDIQRRNAAAMQTDAYALLNNVVLWKDAPDSGKATSADREWRYYSLNLADLILDRGIVSGKIDGLEALGSAVWLLGDRVEVQAADPQERALAQLIVDVKKYLSGPESDNFRLNYAVAMCEGERRFALLKKALGAGEKGPRAAALFNEAREFFHLAAEWSGTGQGKATAVASYLDLVNVALSGMKDTLTPALYTSLTEVPGAINAGTAAAMYRKMADRERGGWEQLRFTDRRDYLDSSRSLWNAVRRNSLIMGDYYLGKMDPNDFQSVMANAEPAEKALLRYVNLFDEYAVGSHREIVPDSAYFSYAESLKKLSRIQQIVYSYNNNSDLRTSFLNNLVKGITIYPYDNSLNDYVTLTSAMNTGIISMTPEMLVQDVVSNSAVAKCLQSNTSYCDKNTRQGLEWTINTIKTKRYDAGNRSTLNDIKALVKQWRDESAADSTSAASGSGRQRDAIFSLADRFEAKIGQLEALTVAGREQLDKSKAEGLPCEKADEASERLMAGRGEAGAILHELSAACVAYGNGGISPAGSAGNKDLEFSTKLADCADDLFARTTDRIYAVGMEKLAYDLARNENHPMHKIIKSGFYSKFGS
jgi:hypothetical protein